jgi:hypothetical protein
LSIIAGSGGSSNDVIATVAAFNSASQNKNVPYFFCSCGGMGEWQSVLEMQLVAGASRSLQQAEEGGEVSCSGQ